MAKGKLKGKIIKLTPKKESELFSDLRDGSVGCPIVEIIESQQRMLNNLLEVNRGLIESNDRLFNLIEVIIGLKSNRNTDVN